MSNRDNFAGGLILGTLIGGIVGGIIGAVVATARSRDEGAEDGKSLNEQKSSLSTEGRMEAARRGLENKIAQLNTAIDDVREQLGTVNGGAQREEVTPSELYGDN